MTASQARPDNNGFRGGVWSWFVRQVRSWFEIPYGYEDENGFHYGAQPPPAWFQPAARGASGTLADRAHQAMKYPVSLAEEPTVNAPAKVVHAPAS